MDRKMAYGRHKGKMFTEIMSQDPSYAVELRKIHGGLKPENVPKYVTVFLDWVTLYNRHLGVADPVSGQSKPRRSGLPPRLERPCTGGCNRFTKLGSNASTEMYTCLDCGHGESREREQVPTWNPDDCPHTNLDNRGSTKNTVMFWRKD